jgi:F0F1-type ATP synthase membrane subunit c/vacuolar-type H+-ATPase subunit K
MPLLLSALVVMDVALQEMIVILLYLAYGVIESANQVVGPLPDEWTIIYTVLLPSAALIGTASLIKGLVGHTAMESLGGLTRETYSKVLVKIVMVEPLAFLGFIWALINMPLPL